MKFENVINKLFYQDYWRIGYFYFNGDMQDFELSDSINWLSLSNYDYEADPFVFNLNDKTYIAYEVFDFTHGNGKLAVCDLEGTQYDFFDEINLEYGHKSYPFMFQYEGGLFCLPEQSDTKNLTIYKFDIKKNRFVHYKSILKNVEIIDPHIMFMDEIILCYSDNTSPFESKIHRLDCALNCLDDPITTCESSEFGRNGGLLNYKGNYYRVAQNCSEYYGMNVSIHKVSSNDFDNYSEIHIKNIMPPQKYPYGLHTLNNYNNVFIIDAKLKKFNVFNPFRKLLNKTMKKFKVEKKYKQEQSR